MSAADGSLIAAGRTLPEPGASVIAEQAAERPLRVGFRRTLRQGIRTLPRHLRVVIERLLLENDTCD